MLFTNFTDDNQSRVLDGIEFTLREIEVLACLLCGQKVNKQLAFILSITEKTVQIHIGNILKKIGCYSREQVIDWLKRSEKQQELIALYNQKLLPEALFKDALEKIKITLKKPSQKTRKENCLILYRKKQPEQADFLKKLTGHLSGLGIKQIFSIATEEHQNVKHVLEKLMQAPDLCLCILPWHEESSSKRQKLTLDLPDILKQKRQLFLEAIFLLLEGSSEGNVAKRTSIDFAHSNYYVGFFQLIKKLWPSVDLEPFIQKFRQLESSMIFEEKKPLIRFPYARQESVQQKIVAHWSLDLLKQGKSQFFIGVFLCITSVLSLGLMSRGQSNYSSEAQNGLTTSSKIIHSALGLPADNALLLRPQLIKQIEHKLKRTKTHASIPTVALVGIVGMGGVGKTTLARCYARSHSFPLIWEINAETVESLINSFKELAQVLAKTKEQKEELSLIKCIQAPEQKVKELLNFVKELLRTYSNWLLIYDNVENFADIKMYFPDDPEMWGHGQVIVTTRDSNIADADCIKTGSVLELGELNEQEALTLFCKIFYNRELYQLSAAQKTQIKKFLIQIPSFPLDILTAAYYMKNAHINFEEYLERVAQSLQGFEEIQKNLLMEKSHYSKTRYGVLTLSFKRILEVNPAFKELLLFICLLDSQNIPRKLLELFKKDTVVDEFMHQLRKYSLFTSESSIDVQNTRAWFSLHRSAQCAGYSFLSLLLTPPEKEAIAGKIIDALKTYYDASAKKGSADARVLIPHLEKLLKTLRFMNFLQKYITEIYALLGKAVIYGHSNYLLGKTYLLEVTRQPCLSDLTMAKVYQDLGEISMMEQDFAQGIFYTNKSTVLYKKDSSGEPEVLENLITLLHAYTYLDDFEEAKYYAQEAFKKLKNLKTDEHTKKDFAARIYSRLATVYNYQYLHGPYGQEAEKYALKALSILGAEEFFFKENKKPTEPLSSQVIISKAKLGKVYSMLGQYEKMHDCIQEVQYISDHRLDNHVHNFLSADVQRFLGEFYLRHNKEQLAEETLTHSHDLLTKIVDVRNTYGLLLLRTEARTRLGKYKEAYEDFLSYRNLEKPKLNYLTLLNATAFYHAAIIKYRLNEYSLSIEHFNEFFEEAAVFCRRFFDSDVFKEMEKKGLFLKTQPATNLETVIEGSLKRSADIFIAIYDREHPFVRDYVLKTFLFGLEQADIKENEI